MIEQEDRTLTPLEMLRIKREDAVSKLEAGDKNLFGIYLSVLTIELNQEMRWLTGPGRDTPEAVMLNIYSTSILADMYLEDTRTALERGVTPVWLDLAAVNFMIGFGHRWYRILFDGYLELKKKANEMGIRGIETYLISTTANS